MLAWGDDCWGGARPNSDTFAWKHGGFTWLMHYPSEKKFEHWGVFSWLDTNGYTLNSVWGGSWNGDSWLNADGYLWNGINVYELTWDAMVSKNDSIKVMKRFAQEIMSHDLLSRSMSKSLESTIATLSMLHKAMYKRLLDDKVHCRHKFNHADWMESTYPWQGCKDAWTDWSDAKWNKDTFTWNNGNFMWSMYSAQSTRTEFWNGDSWFNADGYSWNGRIVAHGLRWADCINGNDSVKVFKNIADLAVAHDFLNNHVKSINNEGVCIGDIMSKEAQFHRLFVKNMYIREKPLRKIKPQHSCNVNIKDLRVHNSNAVVSDIIIGNNQIPTDAPAGYSDWAQFVSGDYTYKDALVKMEVKSEENATVVEIPEYKVVVDLPDIVDKGIFRIDEPIEKFIPFNVEFYQPPNVAITAVSTDGFDDFYMPVYTTGRTDGFFVKLVGSDKQLKVGMISWQAVGV